MLERLSECAALETEIVHLLLADELADQRIQVVRRDEALRHLPGLDDVAKVVGVELFELERGRLVFGEIENERRRLDQVERDEGAKVVGREVATGAEALAVDFEVGPVRFRFGVKAVLFGELHVDARAQAREKRGCEVACILALRLD